MKLKYNINTIINFADKLKTSNCDYNIEAIILENKCLCIYNHKNIFIFNKIYQLIHTIDNNDVCYYNSMWNIIPILNYPNLFAVGGPSILYLYEIQLKSKKKVILNIKLINQKNIKIKHLISFHYHVLIYYIFFKIIFLFII